MNAATLFQSPVSSAASPRRARSVAAVFAGLGTVVVLSSAADAICHATHVYPTQGGAMATGLYLVATAYRAVFQIAGGYVTARLAPHRAGKHVAVLALTGLLLACLGTVAAATAGAALGPLWYPLALVALSVPTVWLGGALAVRRRARFEGST